jgi:hypothetical protein
VWQGMWKGRGCGGSSVVSLSSQIQAMQATIAALATGNNDMSTLTDLPKPPAQTPISPSPTDQSNASESSKQKAIGPLVGGLKHNSCGSGIACLRVSNVHSSATDQSLMVPMLVSAYNVNSHTVGHLEEDSHADIHCANVEIVQSATAFQHDNGIVYYLIMTNSLWFGDDIEHSLFNGLIAKDTGVNLCTDPYDQC